VARELGVPPAWLTAPLERLLQVEGAEGADDRLDRIEAKLDQVIAERQAGLDDLPQRVVEALRPFGQTRPDTGSAGSAAESPEAGR
jgi:hypothetical protein